MPQLIVRILVGVVGALAVLLALRIWIDPAAVGETLGLVGMGGLGRATLRADLGGFFGAAGIMALAGAIRNDRRLLTVPLVMIGLALTGRVITRFADGLTPAQVPPMLIEAVLVVILAGGRRILGVGGRR
jgi:hypothetical protein